MWSFVIVFLLALVVGLIVHFMLSRWNGTSACEECAKKTKTASIWENLESPSPSVGGTKTSTPDNESEGDISD